MFQKRALLTAAAVTAAIAARGSAARADGSSVYAVTTLLADSAIYHPTVAVDPNLQDTWGLAIRPAGAGGHFWLTNDLSGTASTYQGDVNGTPLHQDGLQTTYVTGSAAEDTGVASVTGVVYNAASDVAGQPVEFPVVGTTYNYTSGTPVLSTAATYSGSAKFVFVTKSGTISAWASKTAAAMPATVVIKDYSKASGVPLPGGDKTNPAYTGVAMTALPYTTVNGVKVGGNRLYAADFTSNNRIQVFDDNWNDVSSSVTFQRPAGLPAKDAPFNVQYLTDPNGGAAGNGSHLFVTYAQPADENGEEVDLQGAGHVVEYNLDGSIDRDFPTTSVLDAPWGMAIAPDSFGKYGGDLIVGNFGGTTVVAPDLVAYNLSTGAFAGYLSDSTGAGIYVDGVWGLTFGNGAGLGDANSLYFTAGPNNETDGIFGKITVTAVPEPAAAGTLLAVTAVVGCRRRRERP